jgi:SIR2-like domain/TIR domain
VGSTEPQAPGVRPSDDGLDAPALKIFINYRREDAQGDAGRLYDRLKDRFGADNVFLDVESIAPGMQWLKEIKARGAHGGAFLALIGSNWLTSLTGRRLASAAVRAVAVDDYVRREIEWALRDWPGVVIPVLIDVTMPEASKLPRSIRNLTRQQAVELRGASYERDVANLIERLDRISGDEAEPEPEPDQGDQAGPGRLVNPNHARTVPAGVMPPDDEHYHQVLRYMVDLGTVVPILGSRVCGSLPDSHELARFIAEKLDLPHLAETHDLAGIAQYVAVTIGDTDLHKTIRTAIGDRDPNPVHRFFARFPKRLEALGVEPHYQLILTTSYDRALEQAFEDENEPFDVAIYTARTGQFIHIPWGQDDAEPLAIPVQAPKDYLGFPINIDDDELDRTVIVKILGAPDVREGDVERRNDYLVTEDQYIDYLPTDDVSGVIPHQILAILRSSHCLFLGYTMRDWNARVFLRRLWRQQPLTEDSWAVESEPDLLEKKGWRLYSRVELLAASLSDYVSELDSRLDARALSRA